MKAKNSKLIFACSIIIILALSIWSRFLIIDKHFTHVDDIGVAWSILKLKEDFIKLDNDCENNFIKLATTCRHQWALNKYDQYIQKNQYKEITNPLEKFLKKIKLRDFARTSFYTFMAYNIVPMSWSYSPLQFYFTDLLLKPNMNYENIKFFGRLPSTILSILSILLIAFTVRFYSNKNETYFGGIFASLFLTTSLQSIIYSAQMSNYSAGVFSVVALIFILGYLINMNRISSTTALIFGFFLALLCSLQYLVLIFIPGFLIAFFIVGKSSYKNKLLSTLQGTISFFIIAIPFVFLTLMQHLENNVGINWNIGPNGEFGMISVKTGIINLIFDFFAKISNLHLIIESMVMPIKEDDTTFGFLKYIIWIFMAVGFLTAVFEREKRGFVIFSIISFLIWCALLINGVLSFGPTRHLMVMLPLFIMFKVFGLMYLINFLKKLFSNHVIIISLVSIWLFAFISGYESFFKERQDGFIENDIKNYFQKYSVDIVAGDISVSPYFMPSLSNTSIVIDNITNINQIKINDKKIEYRVQNEIFVGVLSRQKRSDRWLSKIYNNIAKTKNLPKFQNIEILKLIENKSNREVDYSSLTKNGTNSTYIYIFKMS